jgi:hypothetical protein
MSTEAQFTGSLLRELRRRMPEAVVFKFNDRFTSGIPDCSVTLDGITTWFELKVGTNHVTRIQWETLRRLKRGYLVTCHPHVCDVIYAVREYDANHSLDGGPFDFDNLLAHLERIIRSN